MDYPIRSSRNLPSPRLELRWNKAGTVCAYNLVYPLHHYDIRAEGKDGALGKHRQRVIELGKTERDGPSNIVGKDRIDSPFRDGAHASWDGVVLNLPLFVVAGAKAQQRETAPPLSPEPKESA